MAGLDVSALAVWLSGILTSLLAWSDSHRLALHGVRMRENVTTSLPGSAIGCAGPAGTFIASHCFVGSGVCGLIGSDPSFPYGRTTGLSIIIA